jgi:hypothetical protein
MNRIGMTVRARVTRRALVFALLMAAVALACAVQVPPSGGPEDTTPPHIASTVPAPDSSGVDPSTPIRLTFSDPMTRGRLERSVIFSPSITLERAAWEGETLVIYPDSGLQRDTTYLVTVKPGYRDRHGVPSKNTYTFAFATGAKLDSARVEGVVYFKREPTARALVRAFRLPRGEQFDPKAARPGREAATKQDGTYQLRYLPDNDARFVLIAFVDLNQNGTLDVDTEPSLVYPDTVFLTASVPVVQGIDFAIIDPKEPATVSGSIFNETGIDTMAVSVRMTAVGDSTLVPLFGVCPPDGKFEFKRVMAGTYLLQAFIDLRADSACGTWACPDSSAAACLEPCVQADTLHVAPGAKVTVPPITLRRQGMP